MSDGEEHEIYRFNKETGILTVHSPPRKRNSREGEIIAGIVLLLVSILSFSSFIGSTRLAPWPFWGLIALLVSIYTFIFALILLSPD